MIIKDWKMDYAEHKGLLCTAPCDMYSVLLSHGLIKDPYYGTNEHELFSLSGKGCVFYSELNLTKSELESDKIELVLYGIDTICDIYLNGTFIDSVMNMHRMYEYDIKPLVREKNEIRLEIKAPLEYFEKMEKLHHIYMDDNSTKGASHLRKAFYMSGWDWAPKLPNMGIFRDVEVRCYNVDRIDEVLILQHHKGTEVTLDVSARLKHSTKGLRLVCEVDGQCVELEDEKGEITIKSPRLWWPNGYGEQALYEVKFYLYKQDTLLDTVTRTIGLRTLELSQDIDEGGREFCFKVNGIKIFAMGANHVPIDSLPSRETDERLEKLIQDCVFANFNCVRVWGGAYYPRDYFYELCDRYGLVVWQDFMVACANVWLRPEFEREFVAEAIYNIKRIRHHASLGLLCGNNEMEEAICHWDCADGDDPEVRRDYLRLYEKILPELCLEHAPWISYISSSPTSGGNFDNPNDNTRGDVHFWDVWNGGCDFDEYRKHKFRFCSEYGFESLPCVKTIDEFCPDDERNVLSYTMEAHQKHWHGNVKLLRYLAEVYQLPTTLEGVVYASQLNQANAIKYGVEHFRRCRGYTMGSVYWQLNDSWPVASWSSIDYYGRYKALHYFARRFYQGVALGLFNEGEQIALNVSNETTSRFDGQIRVRVMKNDFTPVLELELDASVEPLSSLDIATLPNAPFNGTRDTYLVAELYDKDGSLISSGVELGTKPKHFKFLDPAIKVEASATQGGVYLTLSSVALAKNVYISFKNHDIELSDNYFDIASAQPIRVLAKTDLSPSELLKELSIISVYDISRANK